MATRKHLLILSLAVTTLFGTAAAVAQETTEREIEVAEQPLPDALKFVADEFGLQLAFFSEVAEGIDAPELNGTYTQDQALDSLLADTRLEYDYMENGTVVVQTAASLDSGDREPGKFQPASSLVLMAQNQTSVERSRTNNSNEKTSEGDEDIRPLEEIIVVGSHIRGAQPVGSQVITIDRQQIDQGGFSTVQDIMHSVPQNFKGGINEDERSTDNDSNLAGGSAINLRGLGVGSTLTLVNGRRLAPSGLAGSFTDVSNIPASSIERIEVLADGASAVYGSDAIGGVVNIILRDDYEGAETRLRFGTATEGEPDEYLASQSFGANWDTGHVLFSYEYYSREILGYEDRSFTASSDLTPFGGDDTRDAFSVPGNIEGAPGFAIPTGQDGTNLTPADLLTGEVNLFDRNTGRTLLREQKRQSVFLTIAQELGGKVELFAEGRFSDRDYQLPFGPFPLTLTVPSTNAFYVDALGDGSDLRINYNLHQDFVGFVDNGGNTKNYNGVLGARIDVANDWQLQIYGSHSSERRDATSSPIDTRGALITALADSDPATAFNPFGDGSFQQNPDTLRSIVIPRMLQGESDVSSVNFVADGTLFQLPAGAAKLAVGASYDDYSRDSRSFNDVPGGSSSEFAYRRDVSAVFGEFLIPFFDKANRRPGLEHLILTASARYEDYDDVGLTINPKFGIEWSPIEGLNFRGTYGDSFRAPDLSELDDSSNFMFSIDLNDPSSATGTTRSLVRVGENSHLKNETATTWTLGLDLVPNGLPNFEFDLTYYNIDFTDRIARAAGATIIFFNEDRFASAITRNPTQAEIDVVCNSGDIYRDFLGFGSCSTAGLDAIVDARPINAAITETDGLDFNVRYGFDTKAAGRFDFHVGGSYILSFDEAFGPTALVFELVNTAENPVGLRMRNSVAWSNQQGWSAAAFLNYIDSYTDDLSSPNRKIDSWTTVDLTVAYKSEDQLRSMGLNNSTFSLSVQNLFDAAPPFFNNARGYGYDPKNASPLGQFISFTFTKDW